MKRTCVNDFACRAKGNYAWGGREESTGCCVGFTAEGAEITEGKEEGSVMGVLVWPAGGSGFGVLGAGFLALTPVSSTGQALSQDGRGDMGKGRSCFEVH